MFNQYSFIFISIVLIVLAGFILLRNDPTARDFLAFGTIAAGFVAAWFLLHPVQTPLMDDAQKVKAVIGAGQPVLLEFQSPY